MASNVRSSWIRIEAALIGVLKDVVVRAIADNIDRLLMYQESCLTKIHINLGELQSRLKRYGDFTQRPSTDWSSLDVSLDYALDSFVKRVEKHIIALELSSQLLSRLTSTQPVESPIVPTSRFPGSPEILTQHVRGLLDTRSKGELRHPPFIAAEAFEQLSALGPNTVSAWHAKSRDDGRHVILNDTAYSEDLPPYVIKKTVQELAYLLSPLEVTNCSLPQCTALICHTSVKYTYALSLPEAHLTPISLRSKYDEKEVSLSVKISYARALCRAIMFLHTANSVHKNIRPENIIVSKRSSSGEKKLCLIGLEQIRAELAHSALRPDMEWYKNLYRHHSRQGLLMQEFYQMQHDMYSLGVCLLELGLWYSFVVTDYSGGLQTPMPNPKLELDGLEKGKIRAKVVQDKFIDMANNHLPAKAGNVYTDVVLSCLTCLEKEEHNRFQIPQNLKDDAGLLVGVEFVKKIMGRLDEIVI